MKSEENWKATQPREPSSDDPIVRACVLIRVRSGRHYQVAREITQYQGVKAAFAVVGAADVVARIEVADMKGLVALGTRIGNLEDVVTTETLVGAEV